MVPALPTASSPLISQHLTVGCSTGFMEDLREDWPGLVDAAAAISGVAVELSAISARELPGLLAFLEAAPRLPFAYISVHAPSKGLEDESGVVDALSLLPAWINAVVVHPDAMQDASRYGVLGRRLVIENMDTRKQTGTTVAELAAVFDVLPHAGLCLDVAHAKDVDVTMEGAGAILDAFSSRLRHVHISSLDDERHHVPLTPDDEMRFAPVLSRCRDVPWILEAPPPSW
jgi:sugar phosphate isomerase/epimerase